MGKITQEVEAEFQSHLDRLKEARERLEAFNDKFIYPDTLYLFKSDSATTDTSSALATVEHFSNLTRWQIPTLLDSLKSKLQELTAPPNIRRRDERHRLL